MPRNSIIGFLLGLVGLSKIVGFTTPWLMLIYPALVVIIVMSLFADFSKVKFAAQAGVIVIFQIITMVRKGNQKKSETASK